jgi:hypothetical protein
MPIEPSNWLTTPKSLFSNHIQTVDAATGDVTTGR